MKKLLITYYLLIIPLFIVLGQDSKENADFKLAVNLYKDKLYDLALEQFQTFISLYPNTPQGIEARFYLGLTQSKLKKHEDARITFQNFALTYSENIKAPEAWMNVAEEYVFLKNFSEAALAFERVKTFHPKSKFAPIALLKAADYYEKIGDKSNIRRVLRVLTQEYSTPEVLPARLRLAELFIAENQFEQARTESKRTVDATNDSQLKSRALVLLAKSLIGLGKNNDAELAISEVTKNFKNSASYHEALFMLGSLKNFAGNLDEAMKVWRTLVDDSLKGPKLLRQDAFIEMAEANMRVRDFSRASHLFERAAEIKAMRNREALYKAGVSAEKTGDLRKAAQFYSKALQDSLNNFDYRAILIGALKAAKITENNSEVVKLIEQYRLQFPLDYNLPRILIEGAQIALNKLNAANLAIDYCEMIIKNFPQSEWVDDATFLIGMAKKKNADANGAVAVFESLQYRYPSSEFIPEIQNQIRLIKAFDRSGKEESIQKLALLIGDVIAQKTRGDLAFRLAEIYFHDLKDYQLAAQQYTSALQLDIEESLRKDAWLKLAQSFELLAFYEGEKSEIGKANLLKAIAIYDSISIKYPNSALSEKSVVNAFIHRLKLTDKGDEIRALGTEFINKSTATQGRDLALLALGNSYYQTKNYKDAIPIYLLILKNFLRSENYPSAQYQLGKSLVEVALKDSAVKVLDTFISQNPNHPQSAKAISCLAKFAADSGNVVKSLEYYDLLEKRYFYSRASVDLETLKADAYFNVADYKRAIDWYVRAYEKIKNAFFFTNIEPEAERKIIFKLAVCNERLNNKSDAKKWYAEYVTRDQSTAQAGQAYYALASMAKVENDLDAAAKYLQEVSRVSVISGVKNVAVAAETGDMLFRNEKYSEAIQKYNEAITQTKNDSMIQYLQARIVVSYFRLDNLLEADKRAMDFLKANPRANEYASEFELERGKFQLRKDDLTKAKEKFEIVIKKYPKSKVVPEAFLWLARVHELDQKIPVAVQVYDSLIRLFPKDAIIPRARLNLGNAYYYLEQWDAASRQYRAIVENEQLSPDLVPSAMSNLIMTYKEMEMFDGALELTRKYIERFPDAQDLIDKKIDIGVLYQKLGFYGQSILQLQSLIEAGNFDLEAELRYYIGEAHFYKGDYQQAILEFLKVPYLVTKLSKVDWISTSYYMAGQSYEKMSKYDQAITMYKQIIERKETDVQFKTAAQKEIDRVKTILGKK